MRAFLITGLPRSRTFWLAKLVAELDGVASCAHEPSVNMGGLEDLYNYYNQRMSPSEYVGVSDCMLAPMLPVILKIMPMRTLIVQRPVEDVIASLEAEGLDPSKLPLGMQGIHAVKGHELVREIAFKDLRNSYKVRAALRWLMPDLEIPIKLIEDYQGQVLKIDAMENMAIWEKSAGKTGNMKPMLPPEAMN